jgi:hypothetical protein
MTFQVFFFSKLSVKCNVRSNFQSLLWDLSLEIVCKRENMQINYATYSYSKRRRQNMFGDVRKQGTEENIWT